MLNPGKINIFKLGNIKKLCQIKGLLSSRKKESAVYIDNKKLDGFINRFLTHGCRNVRCEDCMHCHKFVSQAVTIDSEHQTQCLDLHNKIDEEILTGSLWK
jgi:hypothetical protein